MTSLKQTCNKYLIKFSENQSAPKLENMKTSPCSPCAPNLLHVLVSRIPGYHNLCSPAEMSDDWNKTTNGSNVQSNAIAPILVLCLRDLLLLVLVRFSWYVGGVRFTRGWKEDIPPAYMVALCPPPSPIHSILAQHIGSYGRRVHG